MAENSHTPTPSQPGSTGAAIQAPASSSEAANSQQNTEPASADGGTTSNGNGVIVGQPTSSTNVPTSNGASNGTNRTR
ncbi:hypothetical protein V500_01730 [Pseudogymnoascus sp. VKM F-4518 (FW-2643)]|nr:hypothetical protein V500_01730 [Pseudogymnoascus sp. VKM F-4518 (FW-2643)]